MIHHNDRRTLVRFVMLASLTVFILFPAASSASPAEPSARDRTVAVDADGDGIDDEFDPDDDNDGTADDREGSAVNPGPDILDPGKDTDSDGISNVLDPDDNNNGVTDEDDPTSFPPATSGGSPKPPSQGPAPDSPRPPTVNNTGANGDDGGEERFVVQALPVTGVGPHGSGDVPIPILFAILAVSLGSSALWIAKVRRIAIKRALSRP